MPRTYVIAEAGSCHDGVLERARAMIMQARSAGADACKFQYWSDPDKLADRRRVPTAYRQIYRKYRMPEMWLRLLSSDCAECSIDFMCTAYLPEDVPAVAQYVRHFKVASFEAEANDLLRAHTPFLRADRAAGRDRWLILSLGMGACGLVGPQVKWMHCVSAYPAPVEALNLRRIHARGIDGFSDHSSPELTWTGALAVAAGATIIEAHFKGTYTEADNPDAPHAMSWEQLRDYIRHIRFAETCLGTDIYGSETCEDEMAQYRVVIS